MATTRMLSNQRPARNLSKRRQRKSIKDNPVNGVPWGQKAWGSNPAWDLVTGKFTYTPTLLSVNFFPNQGAGAGNVASWDFGDGSTSATFNPNHVYATAGTYVVKLVMKHTPSGQADGSSQTITVSATAELTTVNTNSTKAQIVEWIEFNDPDRSTPDDLMLLTKAELLVIVDEIVAAQNP